MSCQHSLFLSCSNRVCNSDTLVTGYGDTQRLKDARSRKPVLEQRWRMYSNRRREPERVCCYGPLPAGVSVKVWPPHPAANAGGT